MGNRDTDHPISPTGVNARVLCPASTYDMLETSK